MTAKHVGDRVDARMLWQWKGRGRQARARICQSMAPAPFGM